MDARLLELCNEVFLETHGEHLLDTVAARLVRAAASFHATPARFQADVRNWEFESNAGVEDTIALSTLSNLRDVLEVYTYDENGVASTANETTFSGLINPSSETECGGYCVWVRAGDILRVKSYKAFSFISLVSTHPPIPTLDNFDTWLYPNYKHWLVQLGIAITQNAVGDDSSGLSLKLAEDAKRQLIASIPKYKG